MDKRYDQIQSGTPSSSNIILYADPATGELFKCAFSALPITIPANVLAASGVDVTNTGAGDVDYLSFTIPANTLNADTKGFEFFMYCRITNNTNNPLLYWKNNGTDKRTYQPFAANQVTIRTTVMRSTSGQVDINETGFSNAAFLIQQNNKISGWDFTIANTIALGTRTSGAGAINMYGAIIRAINF